MSLGGHRPLSAFWFLRRKNPYLRAPIRSAARTRLVELAPPTTPSKWARRPLRDLRLNSHPFFRSRPPCPCATLWPCTTHKFSCASPTPLQDCAYVTVIHGLLTFDVFPAPWSHSPALSGASARPKSPVYLPIWSTREPAARYVGSAPPLPRGGIDTWEACGQSHAAYAKHQAS